MSSGERFYEECTSELPSPLHTYSTSQSYRHDTSIDKKDRSAFLEYRKSCTFNSVHVSMKDDDKKLRVTNMPLPTSIDNIDKTCIGHTYMPFQYKEKRYFIEAYILGTSINQGGFSNINDSTHKSVVSRPNNSESRRESITSTNMSMEGSKVTMGSASIGISQNIDDASRMDRSLHKHLLNDYQIVVTGHLPLSETAGTNTSKTKQFLNFQQTLHLKFKPSSLIELVLMDQDETRIPTCTLFVATGSSIKMFTLRPTSEMILSTDFISLVDNEIYLIEEADITPKEANIEKQGRNESENDFILQLLQEKQSVPNPPLISTSNITAMHTFVQVVHDKSSTIYGIAYGCQDGSIHIYTFEPRTNNELLSFHESCSSTFIVDGPISCLRFQSQIGQRNDRLQLFVGSLCGFACSFYQNIDNAHTFDEPIAIVEGLYDARLDEEDSIISILEFSCNALEYESCIALGLYSGRLLLLTKNELLDSDNFSDSTMRESGHSLAESGNLYQCIWFYHFPYPVYDIQTTSSTLFTNIIVFSRRGVHLFRSSPHSLAQMTLLKVEKMLYEIQNDFLPRDDSNSKEKN
ncbi:hypothetical protein CTEN210_17068 [Chaetoceros tenuissimus]|uniref:Uncharacterized protein n=1 Tax=Chaetoceros tenuissimus TaxID=426638 RepID=A0AAD3DAT3_9STRA|nr:hypothetical protein CTEN210_17068 [Chaetoceros tenuissimus]